jgi:hypothetical protein
MSICSEHCAAHHVARRAAIRTTADDGTQCELMQVVLTQTDINAC